MSRPREIREAQRHAPKREAWLDQQFDALADETEKDDAEMLENVDPYHGDAYHTMPGIPKFSGTAQPLMRKQEK